MWTGSLVNLLVAKTGKTPVVGDGATILYWTDRAPVTIIAVSASGREVTVQYDKATRTDNHGMSDAQSYTYERDPNGSTKKFTLRKNGRWVVKGGDMNSTALSIGRREKYHDYSF